MIISSIYKTADNDGLIAHIYEHLLAQYVLKRLQDNELFVLSDIILSAKTYGDTCFMDAELYSPEAKKTYDEALREFDKLVIPEDDILRAAGECGIEMNRNIVEVDRSELSKKLREVQISPWRKQIDMAYRKARNESSVNTLFRTSYIKYSKESDDLFRECVLEYSIDESYIQTPIDQALAAIVMQIVALNFLTVVREKYTVYDRGDQWSEASLSVGYRMFLGLIKKDDNIVDQLKCEFMEYVQFLSVSPFCDNLQAALVRCSHNYEQVLLDRGALNSILGGCVIGGKGWLKMADNTLIGQILKAIEIDVYDI
ncbi:hypothetical protein [Candidatus Nanosynbacter sp. TM7-057]|uniref:hypothetical protein n=1 Tax=Candidatus Nanosynbacter sp. TM7-057 TaxID=2902630 RepID=UPI001FB61B82|nr:hypothetical protein [Candidatus Nanosynbacter sp. TM7-057]MCJ1965144.1 hypothetical protein [Candidatus Nanosynbacter sp. TM7-057]